MARSIKTPMLLSAAVAVALPFIVSACGGGGIGCTGVVSAQITSVLAATAALQTTTNAIEGEVLTACKNINSDLGGAPPATTGTMDQQVQAACMAAKTRIEAAAAGATVNFAITPPRCHIDASAQLSCEVDCQATASCQPGTVEVRCTPGELSVVCSGMCSAGGTCEATAQAPQVTCAGTCDGVCMGTCSGGGSMNAAGECSGTCTGMCQGNCHIAPGSAAVNCGAMARCHGTCTGTATAPQCEGELTPPTCMGDASCNAGCEAQGSFKASCDPANVVVTVTGGSSAAALQATLHTNLPALLKVRDGLSDLGTQVGTLASTLTTVGATASGVAACAVTQAQQIVAATQGAAAAAASINVSVSVSVMVTASAGAN